MTGDHHGELRESDYGFACWVQCECGWRSESYDDRQASAKAWIAHAAHCDAQTVYDR